MVTPGDLYGLDTSLMNPGEEYALTDVPDPAYSMEYKGSPAKLLPGSRLKQSDVLLVVGCNRASDPTHALVCCGSSVGWIHVDCLSESTLARVVDCDGGDPGRLVVASLALQHLDWPDHAHHEGSRGGNHRRGGQGC